MIKLLKKGALIKLIYRKSERPQHYKFKYSDTSSLQNPPLVPDLLQGQNLLPQTAHIPWLIGKSLILTQNAEKKFYFRTSYVTSRVLGS